jgi:hypothetical protein
MSEPGSQALFGSLILFLTMLMLFRKLVGRHVFLLT